MNHQENKCENCKLLDTEIEEYKEKLIELEALLENAKRAFNDIWDLANEMLKTI